MAKKMAVYAGMPRFDDQQIGRLREHLRKIDQLDNTVFIVMSDNGADAYDLSQVNFAFKAWYRMHYALDYDSLGGKGAYSHYGQEWLRCRTRRSPTSRATRPKAACACRSSSRGRRVVQGGPHPRCVRLRTDFLPTVLDIAACRCRAMNYKGKKLARPTGTSLLPYLEGKATTVHTPTEVTGYEGTGAQVVYRGDYKLTRDGAPWGDGRWRLFNVAADRRVQGSGG
jgi:arylsulfatase A-like enzyme